LALNFTAMPPEAMKYGFIPICNQTVAYWYKGGGNRRPQVFENAGFPSFFKNSGVQRSMSIERNLILTCV
jgi:hypothetical protein